MSLQMLCTRDADGWYKWYHTEEKPKKNKEGNWHCTVSANTFCGAYGPAYVDDNGKPQPAQKIWTVLHEAAGLEPGEGPVEIELEAKKKDGWHGKCNCS